MALNFNNTSLLSISQEPIKLDSDFKFAVQKNITISGNLLDLSNDSGVENIFIETSDYIEVDTNKLTLGSINKPLDDIVINNTSYGEGYVENFTVTGEQIQIATYEAEIIVKEAGSLSDIILTENVETPTHTSTSGELTLNSSSLENEDLKYLSEFSEDFDFNVSSDDSISISHKISCSFGYRKSLISTKKNIWSGATIQQSKLVNLKNKGKKSIKVAAGTTATHSLTLNQKSDGSPQEYTLMFDYLGQNTKNWGSASVSFSGESISLGSIAGRKNIKLNITSPTSVTITLTANSGQDTFFDNFKLYKTDELPIEKSRALANFLLSNSPNYSIIQSQYEGKFLNLNLFDNFSKQETFNEIELKYSVSKRISHGPKEELDDYSLVQDSSLNFSQDGFITITENSQIKTLRNKNEANLRSAVSSVESGGYLRSLNYITQYNDYFISGCSTPTVTSTPALYLESIGASKNFNFFEGTASLQLIFTNDSAYVKNGSGNTYQHSKNEVINYLEGYFDLNLSGTILGDGSTISERNSNSKIGLDEALNNVSTTLSDIKSRYNLTDDFNIVEKNIDSDTSVGSINYNLRYSNKRSYQVYPSTGTPLVKKYEIEISTDEAIRIFNEFNVNCKVVPQFLKGLKTAKGIQTSISVEGYKGVSIPKLLELAKEILTNKSLMLGVGSDDLIPPTNITQFISSENFSHSSLNNQLNYSRSVMDLSSCPGETPTETEGFGWGDWVVTPTIGEEIPITPTFFAYPTFEPEETTVSTMIYTPYIPITFTPEPDPTPTETQTETFSPITPTETETTTITINQPVDYLYEVFIPKNYNGTIADLMPQGTIVSGKVCFNPSDENPVYPNFAYDPSTINSFNEVFISQSYANTVRPKDCEYLNSSFPGDVRFYSFTFRVPITVSTPLDTREYPYDYYAIEIPEFWNGSFEDLAVDNSSTQILIGGYRSSGIFQYCNANSSSPINMSDNLIKADENNESHPNYNNGEIFAGPLIYKSLSSPVVNDNYDVHEITIPTGSSNTLGQFYTPTKTGVFLITGYRECQGSRKRFNEPAGTSTVTALNYKPGEIVDSCEELTPNRKIESFYIKQFK